MSICERKDGYCYIVWCPGWPGRAGSRAECAHVCVCVCVCVYVCVCAHTIVIVCVYVYV